MPKPPASIPIELYDEFTMGRTIPVYDKYIDNASEEGRTDITPNFTAAKFQQFLEKVRRREENYYGQTDSWLYHALTMYPITNKDVCIIGSACPWYEAIATVYGAKRITVIEYADIPEYISPDLIRYIKPHEVNKKFDACISISSFEHDGLGRYGDPINPNGDIEAMQKVKDYIKPNGILYLAVPLGRDAIYWNAHRIYGDLRFRKLIDGWNIEMMFGYDPKLATTCQHACYQPVIVLEPLKTSQWK